MEYVNDDDDDSIMLMKWMLLYRILMDFYVPVGQALDVCVNISVIIIEWKERILTQSRCRPPCFSCFCVCECVYMHICNMIYKREHDM